MPKRTDIKSILILGAGPIVIGQACEFDYSGAQACKALREEGYRVILVNSNPATIMTDPEMADATYIEPIHWEVVRKIIEKERPDAVLPTMGGQTALNCALELERQGVLEEFGVTMIGATADAIDKAEDRRRFDVAMKKLVWKPRVPVSHTRWKKRWRLPLTWASRALFAHPLPWAVAAAVSLITAKSLKKFAPAVWISPQPKSC